MSAYYALSYDVTEPEKYAGYNPGSMETIMQTLAKHGGKVLAAGGDGKWTADQRSVFVLIEFPTVEAGQAWESDPEYSPARAIRHASTSNRFEVIVPEFVMPG